MAIRLESGGCDCVLAVSYHLPFIRNGIEEVDNVNWDEYAPGRPLDANGVAPNDKDLIWRY